MANYQLLKASIAQVVKTNHNNEITGALLQAVLYEMINSLGEYYQFNGVADLSTNFGTPDPKVAYLAATPGNYQNGLSLGKNEVGVMYYNGYDWLLSKLPIPTKGAVNLQVYTDEPSVNAVIKELYVWDENYSPSAVYRVRQIARHYSGNNSWVLDITKNGNTWLSYYTTQDPESGLFHFEDTVNGFGFYAVMNWEALEYGTQIYDSTGWVLSHKVWNLQYNPYIKAFLNAANITQINDKIAPLGVQQSYTKTFSAQSGQQNLLEIPAGQLAMPATITIDSVTNVPILRIITQTPYTEHNIVNPQPGDHYTFNTTGYVVVAVVDAENSGSVSFTIQNGLYGEVLEHSITLNELGAIKSYSLPFAGTSGQQNLAFIGDFEGEVAVKIIGMTGSFARLLLGIEEGGQTTDFVTIQNPKTGDIFRVQGVTKTGRNLYVAINGATVAGTLTIGVTQNEVKNILMLRSIIVGDKVANSNVMRTIDCVGDSLTYGAGTTPSLYAYPIFLAQFLRYRYLTNNLGVGGENAATILGRMNAIPYQLGADVTIPADVQDIQITLVNCYGQKLLPLLQGASSLLVRIAGVDGLLTTTQTNPSATSADYYFTRATSGNAVDVKAGECVWIRSTAAAGLPYRDKIVWIGQNGGYGLNSDDRYAGDPNSASDRARLIKMIRTYVSGLQGGRYLVLSPPKATNDTLEAEIQAEFGGAFLNVRKWMMANGIRVATDTGWLGSGHPDADDLADITNGLIPRCLRADNVHFNTAGYAAIAYAIAQQIQIVWGIE